MKPPVELHDRYHPDGEEIIRLFAGDWTVVWLEPGQILFSQGDAADFMYIVRSGSVRIVSGSMVFEEVGPGGIVGEMGLIENEMGRSATAIAMNESELVCVDRERFLSLLARAPAFAMTVMRVLSRRLRAMDMRLGMPEASAPAEIEAGLPASN